MPCFAKLALRSSWKLSKPRASPYCAPIGFALTKAAVWRPLATNSSGRLATSFESVSPPTANRLRTPWRNGSAPDSSVLAETGVSDDCERTSSKRVPSAASASIVGVVGFG